MTLDSTDHQYGFSKAAIAKSFNRAAESYDSCAILQKVVGDRLFERLDLVKINPDMIVDLGSGTGNYTRQLQQRYKRIKVFGIDLAWRMSAFANKHKQRKWLSKERYICADAEYLPFADNSVQLVFSNLMLQWIDNPDQLFQEIQRILVPGGLLMFTSFGPDTLKEMRQSWRQTDDRVHVNRFMDMHDIGDSLTKSSFEGAVMDNEIITMTYDSLSELHQDLRGLGEININSGRNRHLTGKSLWQSYLKAYQQFCTAEGDFPASWEIVYGHAWASKKNHPKTIDGQGFTGDIKIVSR